MEESLSVYKKLQDIAEKLNNNEKIDFSKYQCRTYLAYDYNTKSIMQLVTAEPIKILGTVYCLSKDFKREAIKEIGEDILKNFIKD